jgi:hypothetical protein
MNLLAAMSVGNGDLLGGADSDHPISGSCRLDEASLVEMDALWNEAKAKEAC